MWNFWNKRQKRDEAKSFFKKNGCSHFHMGRESPGQYIQYRALRIPKSTERNWIREFLDEKSQYILKMAKPDEIALEYSRFVDVAMNLEQPESIADIVNVMHAIVGRLTTPFAKLIVAEKLIGCTEGFREGVIYLAHNLGLRESSQKLLDTALSLASNAHAQGRLLQRSDEACRDISRLSSQVLGSCPAVDDVSGHAIVYLVEPQREQRLIDPKPDEVIARIQSLEWTNGSKVTLQRLPPGQLSIDRIIVETGLSKERFKVAWCHAISDDYFIRAQVGSLDLVGKILTYAIENDETRLRTAVEWSWPPALDPCQ